MRKIIAALFAILVLVVLSFPAYSFQTSGPVPEHIGVEYSRLSVQRVRNPYARKVPGVTGILSNSSDMDISLSDTLVFYDEKMVPLVFAEINLSIPAKSEIPFARFLKPNPEFETNFPGGNYFTMAINAPYTSWAPKEED